MQLSYFLKRCGSGVGMLTFQSGILNYFMIKKKIKKTFLRDYKPTYRNITPI